METQEITIKPIKSEEQYRAVMKQIDQLIDSQPGSRAFELLEVLSILADDYENKVYPMPTLDPIEAIKLQMEELALTPQDVAPYFGGTNRVSEVLNRKRRLTLTMIRQISQHLHIPVSILVA